MKTVYKKIMMRSIFILIAASLLITFSACRSDDGNENTSEKFKTGDFQVTVTNVEQVGDIVQVDYVVKNISNRDYLFNSDQGYFDVKATIKTTNNNQYQVQSVIGALDKNTSETGAFGLYLATGETAIVNTLSITVIQD